MSRTAIKGKQIIDIMTARNYKFSTQEGKCCFKCSRSGKNPQLCTLYMTNGHTGLITNRA